MRGLGCGRSGCPGDCRCAGICPRQVLRWWRERGKMSVLTDDCPRYCPSGQQQWRRVCVLAGLYRRRRTGCRNGTEEPGLTDLPKRKNLPVRENCPEGPEPLPAAAPPALPCGRLSDICRRVPPAPPVSGRPARRPRLRKASGPYSSSCCPCLPT